MIFRNTRPSFLFGAGILALCAALLLLSGCAASAHLRQKRMEKPSFISQGLASYYGHTLHGHKTASGERYNMHQLTAAHRTLPFNTLVKVTHIKNSKSVVVRINDRGPAGRSRIIDLSYEAARRIDMLKAGVAPVRLDVITP